LTTLTADVIKSSAIEGEFLNQEQVRSSIARKLGLDVSGMVSSSRDIDGIVEMMLDATQNFQQQLTSERLFAWQAALFPTGRTGMVRITVGSWRTAESGSMQVVSEAIGRERVHFEAPAAERIPQEMGRFLLWLEQDQALDPVLKAGISQNCFAIVFRTSVR
jgi:Fic family protein